MLAYFGEVDRTTPHFHDHWDDIQNASGLMPKTPRRWAERALEAELSRWAKSDIEQPRSLEQIEATLGGMAAEAKPEMMRLYGETFLGPTDVSSVASQTDPGIDREPESIEVERRNLVGSDSENGTPERNAAAGPR